MTRTTATGIGFVAVLLWALLALLTAGSAPVPPLQLNAVCFAIGGAIGLVWGAATGTLGVLRGISWKVYAFGTVGLFGYHALYFAALRLAAPHDAEAEAGLIAYLWPLLIVLLSGLLPGERLRLGHLIGAGIAAAGAVLILAGRGLDAGLEALPAYVLAAICALTWSTYSVVSRRLGDVPTASVTVFCLATAVLSLVLHLAFEDTAWPMTGAAWAAMIGLGLGPVGLAFFVWDIGVKKGDIQLLGTASYAAPLLSTVVLVLAGVAEQTPTLLGAAALIALGAGIAARAGRVPRTPAPPGSS